MILSHTQPGLAGAHQAQNANLAIRLAQSFLSQRSPEDYPESLNPLPKAFVAGLENARWPGRCQQLPDTTRENLTWYLDGAHTVESLTCCAEWYASPETGISNPSE